MSFMALYLSFASLSCTEDFSKQAESISRLINVEKRSEEQETKRE